MSAAPRLVPLREAAMPVSRTVIPLAGGSYRQLGVRLWGQGAYEREPVDGSVTKYQQLFRAERGDIVVNKIWARNGSVAVVDETLSGCHGSNEFPMFSPIPERLDPRWMHWVTKTRDFWAQCEQKSHGTSGQNRIKPERFLDVKIPLPPLNEQRRIVARIAECAGKVEETRRIRNEAVDELKALRASGKRHWFDAVLPRARLGDVCEVIDPNPSHRYPTYVPNGVPMITTSDFVGDDGIDSSRAKHVPRSFFDDTLGRFGVQNGDVIFARKGKIGYARSYPVDSALAMTHTLCVLKPNRALLGTKYLLHFARSSHFLQYLTGTMNPNLGVPTLGLNVVRDASIPLPSLDEQRHIARQMDALEQRIGLVEDLQAATAAELDAMLPAILDKAFKGEL